MQSSRDTHDSFILSISDAEQVTVTKQSQRMWDCQTVFVLAQKMSVCIEFHDTRVAVSISHEYSTCFGAHGHICRLTELVVGGPWFESCPEDERRAA
jgi:hypothetical protein